MVIAACKHAPTVSPTVHAEERARLSRLPGDSRTLDAHWDDIELHANVRADHSNATLLMDGLKVRVFKRPGTTRPLRWPTSGSALKHLAPVDVDRITVRGGELDYVDGTSTARPELWIHDVELAVENLTTRQRLAEGLPALLTARAKVQRSGVLRLFISADPFGTGVNAAGRAELRGLRTAELYEFLQVAVNVQAAQGTVDLFVEFEIRQNRLRGGVKVILRNVEVRPSDDDFIDRLKAGFVDVGMDFLSDSVQGRNAVATVVPLAGTLNDPDAEVWPAVIAVVQNAFVQGIAAGFSGVPPAPHEPGQ